MPEDCGGNHVVGDDAAAGRLVAAAAAAVAGRAQTCRTFPSSFNVQPTRASSLFKMDRVWLGEYRAES